MVAVLHQVDGGRVIAIDRAVVLVGRAADCDVVITASQKISRRHCCLVQVDNSYYLRDLGSMNGVWLNGERVKREAVMSLGDKVVIGDAEFLFHPNARIEQRKPQKPQVTPEPANEAKPNPQPAGGKPGNPGNPSPNPATVKPMVVEEVADVEPIEVIEEFEIIDDVIPLGDDGFPLVETNEVEIIDEPIIDLDEMDSFDGEIINLDD